MKTLLFTSPSCGPCKQLKMDLYNLELKQDVITEVNVSQPENVGLLDTYGIRSVPTLVFLDDDEEIIRVRVGYTGNANELKELFNGNN